MGAFLSRGKKKKRTKQNMVAGGSAVAVAVASTPKSQPTCPPCINDLLNGNKLLPDPNISESSTENPKPRSLAKRLRDETSELMQLSGNERVIYTQAKILKTDLDNDPNVQTIYAREKELNTQVNSLLGLFVGFWKKKEYSDVKSFGVVIIPGEYVYTFKVILGIVLLHTLLPIMFLFIVPFCIGFIKSETKQILLILVALTVIFLLQKFVIADNSKILIEYQKK